MSVALAWIEKRAAWLLAGALASIVFACSMTFHEYWRDECQAVLLAEETPFSELLGALRYEGHPPLLHLLLKLASFVLPRPFALSVVGALGFATLLAGTYRWLRAFTAASPRCAVLCTALLAATYTYGYELGIISRGYGYGLGLALVGAALAKQTSPDDPRRRLVWVALSLGGSIISSVHTAVLASSIALAFGVDALRRPGARVPRMKRLALGFALPLVPFVLVLGYVVVAPSDRYFTWIPSGFHAPANFFEEVWKLAEHAFSPAGWWDLAWVGGIAVTVALLAGIAYLLFVQTHDDDQLGWFFSATAISSAGVIVLCVFRYFGEYRHHTVLVLPWILCMTGVVLARPRMRRRLVVAIPLAMWFAHQVWLLAGSVQRDVTRAFSQTSEIAEHLPPDAKLVSMYDALATCVSYLRPDVELRSAQAKGRPFTFVTWDRQRAHHARPIDVVTAACTDRASVYLALPIGTGGRSGLALGPNLLPHTDKALTGEYFELYEVPCPPRLRDSN